MVRDREISMKNAKELMLEYTAFYPGFQFENTKVLIDTPEQVFAEFEATAVSSKTGRIVHQLFFSRLVAENGKIKLFREALNTFEVARANVQDSAGLF